MLRTRGTLYTNRATGLLIPVTGNPTKFLGSPFVFWQGTSDIAGQGTAPYGWIVGYLSKNS
jgi:hypothetical protein